MGLFDAFSSSQGTRNARLAAAAEQEKLGAGQKKSIGALNTGYQQADPYLAQAQQLYALLRPQEQAGYTMYQNALGLNGPQGNQAALGAFQQGPGYQFALDQANQNVLRNAAAVGGVASGNTLMGLSDRAQQLQNQEYGSWLDRLKGFDPSRSIGGEASVLGSRAGMRYGLGQDIAGVYKQFAPQMAQSAGQMYANINAAQQTANNNTWGAILGLANAGAKAYGAS